MQSLHLCLSFSQRLSHRVGRSVGLGGVLLAAVVLSAGCDDKSPQTRQSTASLRSSGKSGGTVQQAPGGGYVESSENAQDRAEAVRRVCQRKASSDLPSCWSAEVDRTKSRKLEARIGLMLSVSPAGKAEKVEVISPVAEQQTIEQCVADAARGWSYPDGTETATVRCDFFLRSSQ